MRKLISHFGVLLLLLWKIGLVKQGLAPVSIKQCRRLSKPWKLTTQSNLFTRKGRSKIGEWNMRKLSVRLNTLRASGSAASSAESLLCVVGFPMTLSQLILDQGENGIHTAVERLMFDILLPFAKTNFTMMSPQKRRSLFE
jgi:hypothetical protein